MKTESELIDCKKCDYYRYGECTAYPCAYDDDVLGCEDESFQD